MDGEARPTDGSIEVTATQDLTSTPFDVENHADFFQLKEYCNATQRNASGGGRLRRLFTKSGSPSIAMTLDAMLQYQDDPLPVPLLCTSANMTSKALKMFSNIRTFLNSRDVALTANLSLEMIQNLLQMGLKKVEMRDELYMQMLKQSRKNEDPQSKLRIWILFYAVASTMPPSKQYIPLLTQYIHEVRKEDCSIPQVKAQVNGT